MAIMGAFSPQFCDLAGRSCANKEDSASISTDPNPQDVEISPPSVAEGRAPRNDFRSVMTHKYYMSEDNRCNECGERMMGRVSTDDYDQDCFRIPRFCCSDTCMESYIWHKCGRGSLPLRRDRSRRVEIEPGVLVLRPSPQGPPQINPTYPLAGFLARLQDSLPPADVPVSAYCSVAVPGWPKPIPVTSTMPRNVPRLGTKIKSTSESARILREEVLDPIWNAITTVRHPHNLSGLARLMAPITYGRYPRKVFEDAFRMPKECIESVYPAFFRHEYDADHYDQPRLDIVAALHCGEFVRMHPGAFLICSWHPQLCPARCSRIDRHKRVMEEYNWLVFCQGLRPCGRDNLQHSPAAHFRR